MNAHGNQGAPALADPQLGESATPQHSGYAPPGPPGYMNGSPSTNHGKASCFHQPLTDVLLPLMQSLHPVCQVTTTLLVSSSLTPISVLAYHSFPPPTKNPTQPAPQSAPLATNDMKRKSLTSSAYPPQKSQALTSGGRPGIPTKSPVAASSGVLADIDPEGVPANMKTEGEDWFALYVGFTY
jgi:hypothetical protein